MLVAFLDVLKKKIDQETRKHLQQRRGVGDNDIDDTISDGDMETIFPEFTLEDLYKWGQDTFDAADYSYYVRNVVPVGWCGWCDQKQISRYKKALVLPSGLIKIGYALTHIAEEHKELDTYIKYVISPLYHHYITFILLYYNNVTFFLYHFYIIIISPSYH